MVQQTPDQQFQAALAALIAQYILAEQQLLGAVARILQQVTPDPITQLRALSSLRRLVRQVNVRLVRQDASLVPLLARLSIRAGEHDAGTELARIGGGGRKPPGTDLTLSGEPFDFSVPHGIRSVQAIRDDLMSPLEDVRRRLTRLPDDIYKIISPPAGAGQVLGEGYTPAQAQAYAWREYVRRGVTGFTDRSGRDWSLSAYVEMSVRTTAMRAYNDSHMQVMTAAGIDLFTVSDDGHPCPLCFPWQNRILSITDDPRAHATIDQARAAGLWHPNCRHVLLPYLPGVTHLPEPQEWTPDDQVKYDLTQKQRRLELEIRKAKRSLEYARTGEARADARADVLAAQARMRAFINDTGLLRRSRREQLDLADDHLKLPSLQ